MHLRLVLFGSSGACRRRAVSSAEAEATLVRMDAVEVRRPRAGHGAGGGGGRADRRRIPADPDRRAADTLGLVLSPRHALLQLAAGARAARGARLRGRARALPPVRSGPLDALLGARRTAPPALAPSARLAAPSWARTSGVSSVELGRRAAPEQLEAVATRASCQNDQPLSFFGVIRPITEA